jgi:predicted aspartyl protease
MGTFKVTIQVGDPQGTRYESVEALVDTGATYTRAPAPLLQALGVRRERTRLFQIADNRTVERATGQTFVRVEGIEVITIVVFGEPGEDSLLGAYTLEGAGFAVDPVRRLLIPVPALLL